MYVRILCLIAGNTEDKKVPTIVQAFADHKMVGVDCGAGDAHTLFLEDNGECVTTELKIVVCHRSFSDPLQHMTEQSPI